MLYFCLRRFFQLLLSILFRYKVIGVENIPKTGSAVICPNHLSNIDPILVGCASTRVIHFMAKEELFRTPILAWIVPKLNTFPVKRNGNDRKALKQSIQILNEEKLLCIFPEGTRSKTGDPGEAHRGAALMALKTGAHIIPTAIIGPYRLFRSVHICFGKPLEITELKKEKGRSKLANELTDRMMGEINHLIEQHRE